HQGGGDVVVVHVGVTARRGVPGDDGVDERQGGPVGAGQDAAAGHGGRVESDGVVQEEVDAGACVEQAAAEPGAVAADGDVGEGGGGGVQEGEPAAGEVGVVVVEGRRRDLQRGLPDVEEAAAVNRGLVAEDLAAGDGHL